MRILWDTLETLDRAVFRALDLVDEKLAREPLFERTKKQTAHVHQPQRVIEFDRK